MSEMRKLDFPNRVTVELTNDCNVSCTFCNRQKIAMDIGYMDERLYYKIIDEMAQHLPVKLVPFFRGEPLMHPQIIPFIKYAKEKGIGPVQMASNALLMDEKMQDALIDSGIDYISFSLDTTDPEIYKCSRLSGDLNISARNVESMGIKCKERKKRGLHVPTLQVSTINLKEYMPGQKEFIEKWRSYVDVVRVYEQHDEKGQLVDPKIREQLDIFDERKPCRKVFTDMIIYWNGRMALCNYDWDEHKNIGDANIMSLQEAWDSEAYEVVRKMHLCNQFDDGICSECHHWKIDYTENGFIGTSYHAEE
ncbi:MAG: radical SAM/SPASM domain-containing protein [Lachnospiraceae bacterium]|nr:radical SAM/SPASM domain-containing protein [Lachnospiraceae bacterium]